MAAKEALARIVGGKNISDEPDVLKGYGVDVSFARPVAPKLVVRPANKDEVHEIVRWANETKTPLVPVSSGPPRSKGDTVPSTGGAVIVDLRRMNRILRVDRRNRVAMVEPGVTFHHLVPVLEREGMRLNMPLLPRATKSVIGSMLEREPVTIPKYHWDSPDPIGCMEVIFGTGEILMTGEAGGIGPLDVQWKANLAQKIPLGPSQIDFHRLIQGAQGTIGIVTWATMKCELLPKVQKLLYVCADSLERMTDFAYRLLRSRYGEEFLLLNNLTMACLVAETPGEIKEVMEKLPAWILVLCLAGYKYRPEERVAFQLKDIHDIAQQYGLSPVSSIPGVRGLQLLDVLRSPSAEPWRHRYKGGCHDIFFVTTLDRVKKFVDAMYRLTASAGYPSTDLGVYIQPQVQGVNCHCEFNLPFRPASASETEMVHNLFTSASEKLMNMGAFFSRPYGQWADMAYRRDAETTIALRKVKQIFDPNNVMNSGKLCF